MRQTHLWQEEPVETEGSITVSMTIEKLNRERIRLWYRVPNEYRDLITRNCDPFVLATIFLSLTQSAPTMVHGEVSPSLLQNLAEFQAAWGVWRPDQYKPNEIKAEVERETINTAITAIAAFSGGVDSSFTMFRHQTGRCGRLKRHINAGLIVHGFDIPLSEKQTFASASAKSRAMLASLGVELIPIATNFRELKQDWEDAHGAGLASCLMLLQGGYRAGLIGSSDPYNALNLPYGSNPVTDWLLSSQSFQIVHDGASFSRIEKIREIANWPEALTTLRVCWQGPLKDRNCGKCEKCIRTILGFRVMGLGLPPCFEQDVTDSQVLAIKAVKKSQLIELEPILKAAKAARISDSWVNALEKCISRNRRIAVMQERKAALKARLPSSWLLRLRQLRSLFPK